MYHRKELFGELIFKIPTPVFHREDTWHYGGGQVNRANEFHRIIRDIDSGLQEKRGIRQNVSREDRKIVLRQCKSCLP